MNIFTRIKNVKHHIKNLKNQIPYIKNQQKLDKHIAMINEIILLINDVEFMIDHKISAPTMDKLILAHMHLIITTYGTNKGIDIKAVVNEINEVITQPKQLQINRLTDLFIDIETERILSKIKFTYKSNGLSKIDSNVSNNELYAVADELKHQTTPQAFEILLNNMITQFKQHAQWN